MSTLKDQYPHEAKLYSDLNACVRGPVTTSSIRRATLLMLRAHYAHSGNYPEEMEHLNCLTFDPENPDNSELFVGDGSSYDPSNTGNFPGIFVGRAGMRLVKYGMGNKANASVDGSKEVLAKGADVRFTIKHVASNPNVAADLADMSMSLLLAMGPAMSTSMGLSAWEVAGFSEPTKVRDSPELTYATDLALDVSFSWSVGVHLESHRIKKFVMEVNESLG